jgi:hypothetical protein
MIIFLILFFIFYFIYKIFFSSNYFNKLDGMDKILFVCLFLFIIWVLLTLYYLFCIIYGIIYITVEVHPFYSGTPIEDFLHFCLVPRLYYLLSYILLILFFILLHIFGFWIIIILFVPFIIIVPIPIIPFILPVPLKFLLLIPFQKLTDRGILPLMRRILFGFFNEETTKHLLNSSYNIYDFFYENLKEMINDVIILNEPRNEKISKGIQDNKYRASTIDDENEEVSNDIIEKENKNKKLKNKIKEEYLLCVKTQKKLNNYGEDNSASNSFYNNKINSLCNLDTLKTYIKIKT